jgi:hypothetical protein
MIKLFFTFFSMAILTMANAQEMPTFLWQYDQMITPTKVSWSFGFEARPVIGKRITLSYPLSVGTHYGQKRLYVHSTAAHYFLVNVLSDTTSNTSATVVGALAFFLPESIGLYIGPDINPYLHVSLGFAGMDYWKTFGKPREDTRYTLSFGVQYIPRDNYGWKTVVPFIKVFNGTSFNNGVNEWGIRCGVSFVPDSHSGYKAPWFMPKGR